MADARSLVIKPLILIIMMVELLSGAESYYKRGLAAFNQGNSDSATLWLAKASKLHPRDAAIRLAYAKSLSEGKPALLLFQSIASDTTAPDSIRGSALGRLADHAALRQQWANAARLYAQAFTRNPILDLRYKQALALLHSGARDSAQTIWRAIVSIGDSGLARKAQVQLNAAVAETKPEPSSSITVTTVSTTADVERLPSEKTTAPVDTGIACITVNGRFHLQVGAFGSVVNANAMADKLSQTFGLVMVTPFTAHGTSLYRVSLGAFTTREAALTFAQQKLVALKITFSVIAE